MWKCELFVYLSLIISNSLSFYSRYECGFRHLVLGTISAVRRHSCRMGQLSSDPSSHMEHSTLPQVVDTLQQKCRTLARFRDLETNQLLRLNESNSCCFAHDRLDSGVSVLGAYKLRKSVHFKQTAQICSFQTNRANLLSSIKLQ